MRFFIFLWSNFWGKFFYSLLDCKIKLLYVAQDKKKCAKQNICRNQTEIEKGPTKKKKKTNKQTTELKNMKAVIGV